MCTIIVTIRSVLWAVMTIAGSLMILVSLFTNRWLVPTSTPSQGSSLVNIASNAASELGNFGRPFDDEAVGIFLECQKPQGSLVSALNLCLSLKSKN